MPLHSSRVSSKDDRKQTPKTQSGLNRRKNLSSPQSFFKGNARAKNLDDAPRQSKAPHLFSVELTGAQKKYLRGKAHSLKPLVQIGNDGVTEGIVGAIKAALEVHELVKVQTSGGNTAEEKSAEAAEILSSLGQNIHIAGRIGRMVVVYLEKDPKEALIPLPKPAAKKAPPQELKNH